MFCDSPFQTEGTNDDNTSAYDSTPGIDVATEKISKAGKFSLWDCAGQVEYHLTHGMFMGVENSIFTVAYDICHNSKQKWNSVHKHIIVHIIILFHSFALCNSLDMR